MSWVRIDDQFGDHPKIEELSDAAFRLHVKAKCWSSRHDMGGIVTRGALESLARRGRGWRKLVHELKRCVIPKKGPLWEERDDGHFQIHDFEQFNFTTNEAAEHAAAVSEARREAGKRGGKRSAEARREANGTAQPKQKSEANRSKPASKQTEANSKQNEAPIPIPFASKEADEFASAPPSKLDGAGRPIPRKPVFPGRLRDSEYEPSPQMFEWARSHGLDEADLATLRTELDDKLGHDTHTMSFWDEKWLRFVETAVRSKCRSDGGAAPGDSINLDGVTVE